MSGNHNHDINPTFKIIEAAKLAEADSMKLQTYRASKIRITVFSSPFDATVVDFLEEIDGSRRCKS